MKKNFLFLPLLALLSCTQQEIPDVPTLSEADGISNNLVSLDEAIETARLYVSGLKGGNTRSADLKLAKVDLLGKMNTRSADNDTTQLWGYYVINFADDNGFALVAADKRNRPVYALSDEGSLELSDTVGNPGLRSYLNSLPVSSDSLILVGLKPGIIQPTPPGLFPNPAQVEVAPILPASVRTWGQGAPFNQFCINAANSDVRDLTGCAPLAAAMIMSHYEWPTSYQVYSFTWSDMKTNHSSTQLARLLHLLGNKANFKVVYTPTLSIATTEDYGQPFVNMGYTAPVKENFSEAKALSVLRSGNPILIQGNKSENNIDNFWVLDGIYSLSYSNGAIVTPPAPEPVKEYFLHCVWGDNGQGDGYFSFAGNKVGGYPQATAPGDISDEIDTTFSNLKIYSGFSKN
ncbi:MAG: C10 family peptidase [Muribaculaceae bacterium]|nr:C10 family peptidase [Muribaculaceae bacterium]